MLLPEQVPGDVYESNISPLQESAGGDVQPLYTSHSTLLDVAHWEVPGAQVCPFGQKDKEGEYLHWPSLQTPVGKEIKDPSLEQKLEGFEVQFPSPEQPPLMGNFFYFITKKRREEVE